MRIVLDTNVLLAGIATHGICEGILAIAFRDHVVVISDHILYEFTEHYIGKFKATQQQAALAADTFRKQCEVVTPMLIPPGAFEDADDLPILGTALAGQVDCLITGDKQLLALGEYQGIRILSPRHFYNRNRTGG